MSAEQPSSTPKYRFADLLAEPAVRERWERVRTYFFLRESTYDMTHRCNIRCDGCYYYAGDKQFTADKGDPQAWRKLMRDEKARGITFVVLAGAEPALVPELLQACYDEIPLGCIATNGVKRIEQSVGHKIHVSVWGNDATSLRVRKQKDMLEKQLDNYRGDSRTVFVYTFTHDNIDEAGPVIDFLAAHDCKVTFNVFSAPVGYTGALRHTQESLARMRRAMLDLLAAYPRQMLFSPYSAVAHSHRLGLHGLYGCPYPRMNHSADIGLGRSFRQYRSDLTWDRSASCCVPDTDCADCRHYAAGSAVVTSKLYRHATDPDTFKAWLDYVDTYLAVWVTGYEKGENLCRGPVEPPQS